MLGWAAFLEKLAIIYRQQASLESQVRYTETAFQEQERRLDSIELRLDQLEQAQSTLPESLDLVADFACHMFGDAKESDWARIQDWFQTRLGEARKRR